MNFYHKSLDYNFILDYNDLFFEKKDKICLLIIFKEDKKEYLELGTPFLKKYKIIYNPDNKFIGFINDNKKINLKEMILMEIMKIQNELK